MKFLSCGREAVLVEVADLDAALALYAGLRVAGLPGVTDLVPAARTVLIRFDTEVTSPAVVREAVAQLRPGVGVLAEAGAVEISVVYDGPDLHEVASHLGISADEVVARHCGTPWTVAFAGFAPGFGYLTGGDPLFAVPRRESPRTRIPAGSVALAGRYAGVYPNDSPGGWQLIGRTESRMWDLERAEPALLVPGRRVTFTEVSAAGVTATDKTAAGVTATKGTTSDETAAKGTGTEAGV